MDEKLVGWGARGQVADDASRLRCRRSGCSPIRRGCPIWVRGGAPAAGAGCAGWCSGTTARRGGRRCCSRVRRLCRERRHCRWWWPGRYRGRRPGPGRHLRGGRGRRAAAAARPARRMAWRSWCGRGGRGRGLVFLSPVFADRDAIPGRARLGPCAGRWWRGGPTVPVFALGGVTGAAFGGCRAGRLGRGDRRVAVGPADGVSLALPQCFAIAMGDAGFAIAARGTARQYSAQVWLTRP